MMCARVLLGLFSMVLFGFGLSGEALGQGVAPTITAPVTATPAAGKPGIYKLMIKGSNFTKTDTISCTDKYGADAPVPNSTFVNSGEWDVAEFDSEGRYDTRTVTVKNQGGQSATNTVNLPASVAAVAGSAPVIKDVSPNPAASTDGVQTISIYGSGFVGGSTLIYTAPNGHTLDRAAELITVTNGVLISDPNFNAKGVGGVIWKVTVKNPGGSLSNQFVISVAAATAAAAAAAAAVPGTVTAGAATAPAKITGVQPTPIPDTKGAQTLIINGTGFMNGALLTYTNPKNVTQSPVNAEFENATQLIDKTFDSAATDGNWIVTVTNPGGQPLAASFTVGTPPVKPEVTAVSPKPVPVENGVQTLTIKGSGFDPKAKLEYASGDGKTKTEDTPTVSSDGTTITDTSFDDRDDHGKSWPGQWNVAVKNSDGTLSDTKQFTLAPDFYGDADTKDGIFSLLGGVEQSYLSSEANETDGFVRFFSKYPFPLGKTNGQTMTLQDSKLPGTWSPWVVFRDIGAPSQSNTSSVVAAIANPTGTITSSTISAIGYSMDFLIGADLQKYIGTNHKFSFGPILAYGATTPIDSSIATAGFQVPILGTEECHQLQQRFVSGGQSFNKAYSPDLAAGTSAGGNSNCLFNQAGGYTGTNTGTPVSTLAFAGLNRASFMKKYEGGVRAIFRSYLGAPGPQHICDMNSPCSRGVVDLTFGQDAATTGGTLKGLVFKADATIPLLIPNTSNKIVFFASTALRMNNRVADLPPLILAPATAATLSSIPSPDVFVEPYLQPNKDFYRIGIAVNLWSIIQAATKANSGSQ